MTETVLSKLRMLAMHTGGIGDILMLGPSLKRLRKAYPQAEIHFIASPRTKGMLERFDVIDRIISIEARKNIREPIATLMRLRKTRYDCFLAFQPILSAKSSLKFGLFSVFLGAKKTFGRNTDGKGFFFSSKVPESTGDTKHEVMRLSEVAGFVCGKKDFVPCIDVPINGSERTSADGILKAHDINGHDLAVAVAPGFTKPTRGWYEERWAELSDKIIEECNAKVIFVGGKEERSLARDITGMMKNECINLVGKLEIFETAAVIDRAEIFIGNDSGLMHMASALRPFVIALFGPGDFRRIRPYAREEKSKIIRNDHSCSPCYKFNCAKHSCMKSIGVGNVYDTFLAVYESLRTEKGIGKCRRYSGA